jgi:hypothetical protein
MQADGLYLTRFRDVFPGHFGVEISFVFLCFLFGGGLGRSLANRRSSLRNGDTVPTKLHNIVVAHRSRQGSHDHRTCQSFQTDNVTSSWWASVSVAILASSGVPRETQPVWSCSHERPHGRPCWCSEEASAEAAEWQGSQHE